MKKVRTAVFPVGGLGTRFLPATKSTPKEMLPIANKPLIQYAFEEAREAGIERFIFITGRNKNSIMNHFDHAYELQTVLNEKRKEDELHDVRSWLPKAGHIAFVRQQDPLGLGHAVWCARDFVCDEPFVVILADEMVYNHDGHNFLREMIDLYEEKGGNCNIIAVGDVKPEETDKYGIVAQKDDNGRSMQIVNMVEKPKPENAPSNISITGRYILNSTIFSYLEKGHLGSGGEIQLTDAMKEMAKKERFYGLRFKGERFDCGNVVGYLDANIAYSLANKDIEDKVVDLIKKYYDKLNINKK
jgi:UTP--glucose-1-phosphate uridylyltransferase